jgi:hypothetical protein
VAGLVLVAPAVPTNAPEGSSWSRGGASLGSKLRLGLTRAILQATFPFFCMLHAVHADLQRHILSFLLMPTAVHADLRGPATTHHRLLLWGVHEFAPTTSWAFAAGRSLCTACTNIILHAGCRAALVFQLTIRCKLVSGCHV